MTPQELAETRDYYAKKYATHFPADPCEPPQFVPADTVRERMMQVLLGKTLPYLWREELSTRTSAELRELIKQIEGITRD